MSLKHAGMSSLLGAVLIAGCSKKSSDGDTTVINSLFRGDLTVTAHGGDGSGDPLFSLGGTAQFISVTAGGNIIVGQNPPPLPPALPSPPGLVQTVGSWTNTQTISNGNAVVNGSIIAGTTGVDATLNVLTGDLWINGTITAEDNGATETNLIINVPAGTLYFHGSIRTGRVDGISNGDTAGRVTITAQRIIFTGSVDARGEDNPAGFGGHGRLVTFDTESGVGLTSQLLVGGSINTSGGNGQGLDAEAGFGGSFETYSSTASNGSIHIHGTTFNTRGGSASGTGNVLGGGAGSVDLQGRGGVFFNGTVTAVGGDASSSDAGALGGQGGTLFINDLTGPTAGPFALFGSLSLSGGSSSAATGSAGFGGLGGGIEAVTGSDANLGRGVFSFRGGNSNGGGGAGGSASFSALDGSVGDLYFDGVIDVSNGSGPEEQAASSAGSISMSTDLGDIQISGSLILNGANGSSGSSLDGPSAGGLMVAQTGNGDSTDGGTITLRGSIVANGGSDSDGSDDTDGAFGGEVQFFCANAAGSIHLDPGSLIQADGGNAGGPTISPIGGFGGLVTLRTSGGSVGDGTIGGNITMHGSIQARGGTGGGFGGQLEVDSDYFGIPVGGADGRGGDITLLLGATIDVSGGAGPIGGDALNDDLDGVTTPTCVTFDADGADSDDSGENGIVRNLGTILGRGGANNGNGGDVLFDGLDPALGVGPLPGNIDRLGSGAGFDGDFLSQ